MEPDNWIDILESFADRFRYMPYNREATIKYDLMADALCWSDEILYRAHGSNVIIRPVLRYRTTIILGTPDERFREEWEVAKARIPEWIVFRPERCTPSEEYRKIYETYCKECRFGED